MPALFNNIIETEQKHRNKYTKECQNETMNVIYKYFWHQLTGWAQSKGHGAEFKKVLIDNGKLEEETKAKSPKYDSSSSIDDSSASDENDDSDKEFFDAAEKGLLRFLYVCS